MKMPELYSRKKYQRTKRPVQQQELKMLGAIVVHDELPTEKLEESQIDET